jgi:hypothetical protein
MKVIAESAATINVPISTELGYGIKPATAITRSLSALSPIPIPFNSIQRDSALALE